LAVGRDDDLARFAVHDVERNLFTQKNVGQSLGKLIAQLFDLLLVLFLELLGGLLAFALRGLLFVGVFLGRNFHVHDDAVGAGWNLQRGVLHVSGLPAEDRAE